MTGTNISHYEITAELGRGGMGVVYKARDTRLNRDVAIKVLAASLRSNEKARARFEQEARAASALNHDHIGVVHEIGETDDGQMYMALAYYEGETLDTILTAEALEESVATEHAARAASALAAAHASGIVHRDIKPSNLIVPHEGSLKILDFGLATFAGAADLTATGSTIGTMAYMSPEQTKGEEIGPASDVWSLGVVMYEMLAGRKPFDEGYASAVVYSIVNQDPPLLEGVSTAVSDTVMACLAKDPADRPSAARLAEALASSGAPVTQASPGPRAAISRGRVAAGVLLVALLASTPLWMSRGAGEQEPTGIAIIPCEDLSSGQDGLGIGMGLAHEIAQDLSYFSQLRVSESNATRWFRDNPTSATEIGEALGVDYAVNCWVTRDENLVSVRAELVDANSGELVWSDTFEDEQDSVLEVRRRLRDQILDRLRARLTLLVAPDVDQDVDPLAYDYYLKSLEFDHFEGWTTALNFLDLALTQDSTFARAHLMKAGIFLSLYGLGQVGRESISAEFFHHMELAKRYDPDNPMGYYRDGFAHILMKGDWEEAMRIESQAPENVPITWASELDLFNGHLSVWRSEIMGESRLNATAFIRHFTDVHYMMRAGFIADSEIMLSRAQRYFPGDPLILLRVGEMMLMKDEFQQALDLFNAMVEQGGGDDPFVRSYQALSADAVGDTVLAAEILQVMQTIDNSSSRPRFHLTRAILHGTLGNVEKAVQLLKEGVESNAVWSFSYWLYITNPEIRAHPEFTKLMEDTMPSDAWSYARFSKGGRLLNPEEVEAHAFDWRTEYGSNN